jgi:hypothetical protein
MKPDTLKTFAKPATVRDLARIGGNEPASLPNDFGKSRKDNNHGRLL